MAVTPIDALPPAPSRADPSTFASKGDTFLAALANTFTSQLNAAIAGINTAQSSADSDAATASQAASNAAAAANNAQQTAGATAWVSGTTYQQNAVVISQVNFQTYRKKTTAASSTGGVTDPASDGTNWTLLSSGQMFRSARTTNTQLTAADAQKLIDITGGTFTQTFATASAMGSGWYCILRNSGTGYITLDPTSFTNVVMATGETRLIQCDGTAFYTVLIDTTGYFFVREEQSAGTSAQSSNAGGFVNRTLNTVKANTLNGALNSGTLFTLPAGTYRCRVRAPAYNNTSRLSLYNVTDSVATLIGPNASNSGCVDSFVTGVFTITSAKSFNVQHYCTSASTLGVAISNGVEVYTEAEFWKIA